MSEKEIDLSRWVVTMDAGLRFIGKVADASDSRFTLNPAFEYLVQVDARNPDRLNRMEIAIPVDLVGSCPVTVRPTAYYFVSDLPSWRQDELKKVIAAGLAIAEKQRIQKSSGLVIP